MKLKLGLLFIVPALVVGVHQAAAQGTRYFRFSGPTAVVITSLRSDGTMVWSNAQPGSTYTVQTVSSLPGGTNWVDYVQIPATNSVLTNRLIDFDPPAGMALIPAGTFTMGDSLDGDSDASPTDVNVSGFYMDTNLVSYSQWQSVHDWATNHGYSFANAGAGKAAIHPVQTIDWYDAAKWCNARSQQEGLSPVYCTDPGFTQVFTKGETTNVFANWTANGYRLPTEAEWEKAARGGLSGLKFPWGNFIDQSLANYHGDTSGSVVDGQPGYAFDLGPNGYNAAYATGNFPYTSPVGAFAANGYGLCDMAGNVLEWCWDWYGMSYGQPTTSDPTGAAVGIHRVTRGGAWYGFADYARVASRNYSTPDYANDATGFRCVMGL